jgi:hypothetical protein
MLIKSAEHKSKRIALLESLQDPPKPDARQKTRAREEPVRLRRGIQGERGAAHYLDNYFADGRNHALIHDLRLVDGEDAAQIDHLVVGRTFEFYLLETKNFNGGPRINDLGEFSVRYAAHRACAHRERAGRPGRPDQQHVRPQHPEKLQGLVR